MKITDFINIRSGLIGAGFMSVIVFFINLSHGALPALIAGLKQGAYTFLFGGIVVKICETLARKPRVRWMGILLGMSIASLITITAVFFVHNMKGTPEPYYSTLPVIFIGPPGFFFVAKKAR
ncbi:MAG: hypothetical protein ACPG5P_04965, partial [Saprospiraceae bacterium]